MSYRISSIDALTHNIAVANTTVMLCRANVGRIAMTCEQRQELDARVRRQIRELEAISAHLTGRRVHKADSSLATAIGRSPRRSGPVAPEA